MKTNITLCMKPKNNYFLFSFSANTTTADACQRGFPSKNSRDGENCTVKKDLT